jgi:glycosyltransferase involved in cell wall biosynthesis
MNIVFVGETGVPYLNRATDTRLLFFANMSAEKNKVYIVNRMPYKKVNNKMDSLLNKNVKIINLFGFKKLQKIYSRVLFAFISYPVEFVYLLKLNHKVNIDILHVYSGHFVDYVFYFILSKTISSKICMQFVEFDFSPTQKGYYKINGYLIDYKWHIFFNGFISISNYISNHIKNLSPVKPILKIPPICDFEYISSIEKMNKQTNPYLLYCGTAGYINVIETIIKCFELFMKDNLDLNISLILVINGDINKFKPLIKNNKKILIYQNVDFIELIQLYKDAAVLFIPLQSTIREIARFPNKICEYTASKGLILTTNIGEIPFYFKDKESAIIANDFSVESLVEQLDWIFKNQEKLSSIRDNAYKIGYANFHIGNYIEYLDNFFRKL